MEPKVEMFPGQLYIQICGQKGSVNGTDGLGNQAGIAVIALSEITQGACGGG